jgi:hypothetical protein
MAVHGHGAPSKNVESYDHSMVEEHGQATVANPDFRRTKMVRIIGAIALAWIATTSVGNAACEHFPDGVADIRNNCSYGYQCSAERPRVVLRRVLVPRKRQYETYGYNTKSTSGYSSGY